MPVSVFATTTPVPSKQNKTQTAKYSRSPKTMILLAIACHFMIVEAQFFTNKSIGQSNPVAGATNTITVTMVTDTELTAEASSSVTISGLIGAVATNPVTLLDAGDDGAISFSDGVTQGKGAWSSGTLTLTVNAGENLAAGTVYTFGFQITNPSATTTSPTINIAASGSALIASATMTKPGTALYGVANGANPLEVLVPSFGVKSIEQSTPVSGATNTLTVTLTANYHLKAGSTVTISGLMGSQTADNGSLTVASTFGLLGTAGAWTQGPGQLVLTAASTGTIAGTACEVKFDLTNTASDQTSPAVSAVATIKDGSSSTVGSITHAAMAKLGTPLYGVANGANPLEVLVPSFDILSIEQSTPVSGATNTLTVTLTANYDLEVGSTVTISGLTGSQTADVSLNVTLTSGLLGTAGAWTKTTSTGQLVLTAASTGTIAGTACEVTFALQNTATDQASPTVSVAADIHGAIIGGSIISIGVIVEAAMAKLGSELSGVVLGTDPLRVLVPLFGILSIEQSTPVSGATNTLTVTLTANYHLKAGSTVTISGLTGSQTADNGALTVASTSGLLGTAGAWTQGLGQLVLTAASPGTTSGTACMVTFDLTNTASNQTSPAVSVVADIHDASTASVGSIAPAAMAKPGTALYGVANGADPFEVLVPFFTVKAIEQSTPFVGASNTLTMMLTSNYDLSDGSMVTISGLMGSQTENTALPLASTLGVLGTTGTWMGHGTLILTAAAGGPKRGSKTSVSFSLINNAAPQGAVTAKVEAAIGSGGGVGFIALGDLTVLSTPLYEVANGYQPLLVVEPLFGIKDIGQSTPVPSATNTISVTLTSTTHQTMAGSILTISGLAGSATVTGSLPIWASISGLHAASAPLIAATAALSAANIVHTALLSSIQVEAAATAAATLVHTHIYYISMYIPRR